MHASPVLTLFIHTIFSLSPLLQDLVVRHQRELAEREAALSHARDELVSLRTSIANSNAERDIALASEARLSTALKEAVQERDRQMRLAEKLRTFESEVTARETAERAERAAGPCTSASPGQDRTDVFQNVCF